MPSAPGSTPTMMMVIPAMVGEVTEFEVRLRAKPSFDAIRGVVEPHLAGQGLEHVTVLYNGQRADMFVGENSATGIRNIRATAIYQAAALDAIKRGLRTHEDYGDNWPAVCGPAVLFPSRRVWF